VRVCVVAIEARIAAHVAAAFPLLCIDHADHTVQPDRGTQYRSQQCRGDPGRIGNAAGFKHDVLWRRFAVYNRQHRTDQILFQAAADAAVGQLKYPFAPALDQFVGDIQVAEVVHHHRDAQAVVARQDPVQYRRLTGTEKSGKQCQRDRRSEGVIVSGHESVWSDGPAPGISTA
jgi:hypothetical protein